MDDTVVAILVGMMGMLLLLALAWYVIQVIALWKIFTKAGEAGWKSIIPFYNTYIQYKISWKPMMFWISFACIIVGSILGNVDGIISALGSIMCLAAAIINWIALHKLSLAFGHGVGYTIGLIFLNPIFILMLGFGGSEYQGPQQ